jgi:iron-sulfur cluster repair protein YtfE (RIC family)
MEARQILQQQHQEIRGLFKKITSGGDTRTGDVQERDALLARLTARLQLHTRLEESYFYPALEELETKRAEETVLESYEEHAIVDSLLAQLPAVENRNERFLARVRVLQSLVETHIEEEEAVMFEMAEKLGAERLTAIGERMLIYTQEVERLEQLMERATEAARNTERWAARWFERGLAVPRRALGRLAPTRLLRLDERSQWVGVLAARVPTWLLDGAFNALAGLETMTSAPPAPNGQRRGPARAESSSGRAAAA